jgi:hypothetical protein
MKKLIAIAFTCVYLTLTVGVVHATHYCMGRVKSSTLFSFESKKCACARFAAQAENHCCDDEVNLIKIDDDQSLSAKVSLTPEFFIIWENHFLFESKKSTGYEYTFTTIDCKPPGREVPLFVRHCSLILYSESHTA